MLKHIKTVFKNVFIDTVTKQTQEYLKNNKLHGVKRFYDISNERKVQDLTICVTHPSSKGWILERIVKEIAEAIRKPFIVRYSHDGSIKQHSDNYNLVFSHYSVLIKALRKSKINNATGVVCVWVTHIDSDKFLTMDELVNALNFCDHVFISNRTLANFLLSHGVKQEKISVPIGGFDKNLIQNLTKKNRGDAAVLVGSYYPRKRFEKIEVLLSQFPNERFIWYKVGSHSSSQSASITMSDLENKYPNFTIIQLEFSELYNQLKEHSIFLSFSPLEGGPIPLLEAMILGLYPLVTSTGFSKDIIKERETGVLLDPFFDDIQLIEGFKDIQNLAKNSARSRVSNSVSGYNWDNFKQTITAEIYSPGCHDEV